MCHSYLLSAVKNRDTGLSGVLTHLFRNTNPGLLLNSKPKIFRNTPVWRNVTKASAWVGRVYGPCSELTLFAYQCASWIGSVTRFYIILTFLYDLLYCSRGGVWKESAAFHFLWDLARRPLASHIFTQNRAVKGLFAHEVGFSMNAIRG